LSRVNWQQKLIDNGYFARSVPKEYGGYGGDMDIIKLRIIAEEFAKSPIPKAMGGQGIQMLVPTLLSLGTEEQKQQYIRPTLRGEMIWCQGYSEPNSGSDLASLQTKGELDGDEWVINGHKIMTSNGRVADFLVVMCRTEDDDSGNANLKMTQIIVPTDSPGLERIRSVPIWGHTGGDHMEIKYKDVRVPLENALGARGSGHPYTLFPCDLHLCDPK
jgi:alkylation response protein AidB-like acyl-CoA dehydrogenase